MKDESAISLRCKLKLERSTVRYLKRRINDLKDEIAFKEKALARATNIIVGLDKDGKLWDALMSGRIVTGPTLAKPTTD